MSKFGLLILNISFLLNVFLPKFPALAQDYGLYGISSGNELVKIDLSDVNFSQQIIAPLSVLGITAIEYDPVESRMLAISSDPNSAGIIYTLDIDTGALTPLFDLADLTINTAGSSLPGLAYDASVTPERFYISQSQSPGDQILVLERDAGTIFADAGSLPTNTFSAMRGVSIQPGSASLFGVRGISFNSITIFNKSDGSVIQGFPDNGVGGLNGIAFHPQTSVLYGTAADGSLLQIDTSTGTSTILQTYSTGQSAVSDLAFVLFTPTPTPTSTPTATPTSTPTTTPTPTPTVTACPEGGGDGGCACGESPIDINGNPLCAPVTTVTEDTEPAPPVPQVRRQKLTLTFQTFTNISDGRTIEEILEGLTFPAAQKKLSIRYSALVRTSGSRARDFALKVTKRNFLTITKMRPGSYTARYRVEIYRGQNLVATTKFSPRVGFRVGN